MSRLAPVRHRRSVTSADGFSMPSPEEQKSLLINTYAAKRHEHPAGSKAAIYIGIVACTMMVVAGWVLTTGKTLIAPGQPDPTITAVTNSASIFQK